MSELKVLKGRENKLIFVHIPLNFCDKSGGSWKLGDHYSLSEEAISYQVNMVSYWMILGFMDLIQLNSISLN